jgi:cytoskeletal protein CcmA (bactofilin family)
MSMIKRDDNLARANLGPTGPATPPPTPAATSGLLLGAGAEFEGKLTFRGTVRIDALFKGSIFTNDVLVVGEHARIDAEINCGTVIVHGEVNGNIKAKSSVELLGAARVKGDIETPSVRLDKGAILNGAVRMPGSPKPV